MRDLDQLYKFAFEQSPLPVATLEGPNFTFTFVNPTFSQMFPERSLTGKPIFEALPELKGQLFETLLAEAIKTNAICKYDEAPVFIGDEKGGKLRYFNLIFSPEPKAAGTTPAVSIYMHEVSDKVYQQKLDADWSILN